MKDMDTPIPTQLEAEAGEAMRMVLDEWRPRLQDAGIRVEGPHMEREEAEDGWSSQLSVRFFRGGQLVDMFSYSVWSADVPDATPNDVAGALYHDIGAMLNDPTHKA